MTELLLRIDQLQAEYNRDRHHLSLQLLKSMQQLPPDSGFNSETLSNGGSMGNIPANLNLQALLGTGNPAASAPLSDAQLALLIPPPPLFPGFFPFQNGLGGINYPPPYLPQPGVGIPSSAVPALPASVDSTQSVDRGVVAGPDGRQYQTIMTPEGPRFVQLVYQPQTHQDPRQHQMQ